MNENALDPRLYNRQNAAYSVEDIRASHQTPHSQPLPHSVYQLQAVNHPHPRQSSNVESLDPNLRDDDDDDSGQESEQPSPGDANANG